MGRLLENPRQRAGRPQRFPPPGRLSEYFRPAPIRLRAALKSL
jgi:hypothetical protein